MICVLSLVVFSILGLFSAKYRALAKEAFTCVTSSIQRQPCETDLNDRIQASIVGKTLSYSPRVGRLLNDHFKLFSWVLLGLFLLSALFAGQGIYNWVAYGNCNGEDTDENCTFDRITSLSDQPATVETHNSTDQTNNDTVPAP